MHNRYLALALAGACLAVATGCTSSTSPEGALLPEAPALASTGATVTYQIVDMLIYLSTEQTLSEPHVRDSLRVVAGLPEGYEVTGAQYCPDMNARLLPYFTSLPEPSLLFPVLAAFAGVSRHRADELPADSTVAQRLVGKRLGALSFDGPSMSPSQLEVHTDSLDQLIGFSVAMNCTIPAGTSCDTVVSGAMFPIPIGSQVAVYTRPVYVYLDVRVPDDIGGSARTDTVVFYLNSDTVIADTADSIMNGVGAYAQLVVEQSTGLRGCVVSCGLSPAHAARVSTDQHTGITTIHGGERVRDAAVYGVAGALVQRLVPRSTMCWDGTDLSGARAAPGVYVVRITDESGTVCLKTKRAR